MSISRDLSTQHLNISCLVISDLQPNKKISAVIDVIRIYSNLKSIKFFSCAFEFNDLAALLNSLHGKNISALEFNFYGYEEFDDQCARVLAEFLKENTSIIELQIFGETSITSKGTHALSTALSSNKTVKKFYMHCGSRSRFSGIVEPLEKNNTLTDFGLQFKGGIYQPDMSELVCALKLNTPYTSIKYLSLIGFKINYFSLIPLVNALRSNTSLVGLNLRLNSIGNEGLRLLTMLLRSDASHPLTELDLQFTNLTEAEGLDCLIKSNRLTKLLLGDNYFSAKSENEIVNALLENTSLNELSIELSDLPNVDKIQTWVQRKQDQASPRLLEHLFHNGTVFFKSTQREQTVNNMHTITMPAWKL